MTEISLNALSQVADYFKVLSELSRLQVLCALKSGKKNVSEIMQITKLGQANVSKHLKILNQAGIITRHPSGVSAYYQIADPIIFEMCQLVSNHLSLSLEERSPQLKDVIKY